MIVMIDIAIGLDVFYWTHKVRVPLYVCAFIRSFSLEPLVGIFLFLLHDVRMSSNLKSGGARFFGEKFFL